MKRYLVDANVWIAILYTDHSHHEEAVAWMRDLPPQSAYFCRMTQMTVLRLLCNPRVLGQDAVAQNVAWTYYDRMVQNRRVGFVLEPDGIDRVFRDISSRPFLSSNAWPDAYLAAFAIASGMCVKTADQGFRTYHGLDVEFLR